MAQGGKRPGSGRPKGSKDTITQLVRAKIANSLDGLIKEAENTVEQILYSKLPCGVCHGKGKTKFQARRRKVDGIWQDDDFELNDKLGERTCQSCYGSGFERLSPNERLRAALELLTYGHSKRSAIEVSNPDGSMRPQWVVVKPGEVPK